MGKELDDGVVVPGTDNEKGIDTKDSGSGNSDSEDAISGTINERALLRKLDLNLLPAVGILYLLSFLDRSNGLFNHIRPRAEEVERLT